MEPETIVTVLWGLFILSWAASAAWAERSSARMSLGPLTRLYVAGAMAAAVLAVVHLAMPGMRERLWPAQPLLDWPLTIVCALGLAFCWWARLHIGKLWSAGVDRKEGHRVVDSGPYGWVRHPIYSGVIVAALAFALVRARPSGMLLALLFAVFFSLKARKEEEFLREELGDAYDAYRTKVGRLVPGVGLRPSRP
ncbi:MAG TPA: isoprenylcysteine carboxylmethyltransferase family protein [Polyangiaceae bacterium]|nr:isoprenylcysteine carboxylmethyltransferase family protein [Polyangiaceae bacterium]